MIILAVRGKGRVWANWRRAHSLASAPTQRSSLPHLPLSTPVWLVQPWSHAALPSALRTTSASSYRAYATAALDNNSVNSREADLVFAPLNTVDKGKARASDSIPTEEDSAHITPSQVADRFEALGLSTGLAQQLVKTYPFIAHPTAAQVKMIPALLSRNDVLLRAHTGSGKSFGLLLALMAKPRVTYTDPAQAKSATATASLIVVPSNELAAQYVAWARTLIPPTVASSLDSVIQAVVRGDQHLAPEQQVQKLIHRPPHILVATPRRALEILSEPQGSRVLGLQTLQTLALDEADSLLDLPGRFPSAKMIWNNMVHPPAGLKFLNEVMKIRATFSGGQTIPSAGLEPTAGKMGDEIRPPEKYRRTQYQANERLQARGQGWLTPPKILKRYERPLQVVACSATTNAVLRHFLGAKTGWVRIGIKREEQDELSFGRRTPSGRRGDDVTGRWIDLTGMSGMTGLRHREEQVDVRTSASAGKAMPVELNHVCVVVDEGLPPSKAQSQEGINLLPSMRNLSQKRIRRSLQPLASDVTVTEAEAEEEEIAGRALQLAEQNIVRSFQLPPSEVDTTMLESLAYTFALEGVTRGLIFIPPQWSLRSTTAYLTKLGMPVVPLEELQHSPSSSSQVEQDISKDAPKVSVIQSSSGRGLDVARLSHVFILGMEAVRDPVQYAHLAGRTSRIGHGPAEGNGIAVGQQRQRGTVVTLVRGLTLQDTRRNEEIALKRREGERGNKMHKEGDDSTVEVKQDQAGDAEPVSAPSSPKVKGTGRDKGKDAKGLAKPKALLISSAEKRMSTLYARLGVRPGRIELRGMAEEMEMGHEEDQGGQEGR